MACIRTEAHQSNEYLYLYLYRIFSRPQQAVLGLFWECKG